MLFKKKENVEANHSIPIEIKQEDNDTVEETVFKTIVDWGKLKPYIEDENITDIKCNSKTVWIKHIKNGIFCADFNLSEKEISDIAYQISNTEKVQFNQCLPILQADYEDLRIQVVHSSVSPSGINMTIRNTPFVQRIIESEVEKEKYCTLLCLDFIKNAVKNRLGIVNGGETGAGKTELAKLECSYIPKEQGIITIEDTSELHLSTLYPDRNSIEMKINQYMDFDSAIASSMRMDPDWVLLSEARGKEIAKLMTCRSEGHGIITTLHLKKATGLVERIINMYDPVERPSDRLLENMVHEYFDICIHLSCDISYQHTHRYIDEIVIYERNGQENKMVSIYKADADFNVKYVHLPNEFSKLLDRSLVERWNAQCSD